MRSGWCRAFTGKNKIIKIEGGYHGSHDLVEASVSPSLEEAGDVNSPSIISYSQGIPKNIFENILIVPFNNKRATELAIQSNRDDVAAIIVEPVMGAAGIIPAAKEYLMFLRNISKENGILLIFDEIISFRLSPGGHKNGTEFHPT